MWKYNETFDNYQEETAAKTIWKEDLDKLTLTGHIENKNNWKTTTSLTGFEQMFEKYYKDIPSLCNDEVQKRESCGGPYFIGRRDTEFETLIWIE